MMSPFELLSLLVAFALCWLLSQEIVTHERHKEQWNEVYKEDWVGTFASGQRELRLLRLEMLRARRRSAVYHLLVVAILGTLAYHYFWY